MAKVIITKIEPGDKPYIIIPIFIGFVCLPETEPDELELMLCLEGKEFKEDLLNLPNAEKLPDNLEVNFGLNLEKCKIKELTKGLKCRQLNIQNTEIKELPADLKAEIVFTRWSKIPLGYPKPKGVGFLKQ